jgi:coenzyme F420-reducing hydrogenase delta subunit
MAEADNGFSPEITTFTCLYCASTALDTAGTMRTPYPATIKTVKLPCTGKVSVLFMLKAFEQGADGVLIAACPDGNCHYVNGSERAERRVAHAQGILESIGLEKERLAIVKLTASQVGAFAQVVADMTQTISELGPSPLRIARES